MPHNFDDFVANALAGMATRPKALVTWIKRYAEDDAAHLGDVEAALRACVLSGPNNRTRNTLHQQLSQWDWAHEPDWAAGTREITAARRKRIYQLLALSPALCKVLDTHLALYDGSQAILIEGEGACGHWYTDEFQRSHNFYWSRLRKYLLSTRNLPPESVDSLDHATTRILERLADPSAGSPRPGRGLVVGYVQSGKTANFTALIAKGIDAGYRLIIVLSGTTNLLRNQTQRRLDMELVGVENILRGATLEEATHEYMDDDAWPDSFISYGSRPSLSSSVDIVRLTAQHDFESTEAGLNPLDFHFEKAHKNLPLFARDNLNSTGARLVVVKKQKDRLVRLLGDLAELGAAAPAEIPALIIDDESDQASINTLDPRKLRKADEAERTRINHYIVRLLKLLKRAQYVGYTATPFANVLVDPADPEDIYPKDFILSLQRPSGYMGVREFHDFDAVSPNRLSNETAYVRGIPNPKRSSDDRLQEAMDAFVLSAALKVFREHKGVKSLKHHTMLVHESPTKSVHEKTRDRLRALWRAAGYASPGTAQKRLKELFENDFKSVWRDRGRAAGLPFPSTFDALLGPLGEALDRIRAKGDVVLMVNSAEGASVPDFDTGPVWKIIVGGAKLSRGYTVEGLTVSWFRRRTKNQDTLMQMGRWFGFRTGYEDLVRLYIGRKEPDGKTKTLDLYKAFEAMCRDEEDFRAQLVAYERRPDGSPAITPSQVPAFVYNSHPQLRPTGKNRMFNAVLVSAGFDYREPTRQAVNVEGRRHNAALLKTLFFEGTPTSSWVTVKRPDKQRFEVRFAVASHADVITCLEDVRWDGGIQELAAELAFLKGGDCPVDCWWLVAPQVQKGSGGLWTVGRTSFTCVERTRLETRFSVFTSPEHVALAKWLVGEKQEVSVQPQLSQRRRRGVILLYPTWEKDEKPRAAVPVMGFALCLPPVESTRRLIYTVKKRSEPEAIVVRSGGKTTKNSKP